MRFLGVDYGTKRIGLALSDYSATLARPWQMVPARSRPQGSASVVADIVTALRASDDPELDGIVVGLPRRLDGTETDQTPKVRLFVTALSKLTALPVEMQDERLTSVEAESRLAVHERDWRKRKAQIDAVSASILLQDYLDARARVIDRRGSDDATGHGS